MIPKGKSVFTWILPRLANGNMKAFAAAVKAAGVNNVFIKLADGDYAITEPLVPVVINELRLQGVGVWAWQFVYGGSRILGNSIAAREATTILSQIQTYKPDGLLIDAESQYERNGATTWAETYMTSLRAAQPSLPIGLCSFRYPSVHPTFPWHAFLRYTDFHAPQIYWIGAHNPAQQLDRSISELTALAALPIVPIGAAYTEGDFLPTTAEIHDFYLGVIRNQLPGFGYWCWDTQGIQEHPEWLQEITKQTTSTTPPAPGFTIEQRLNQVETWAKTLGYTGPK